MNGKPPFFREVFYSHLTNALQKMYTIYEREVDTMEITCTDEPAVDIRELFAGYSGDYRPQELDWGSAEGTEAW